MQEELGNVSRELEILQGTKMIQGIKNTITEMKNVFDGLINRLDMAWEILSKLGDNSIKMAHTENWKEKNTGKKKKQKTEHPGTVTQVQIT